MGCFEVGKEGSHSQLFSAAMLQIKLIHINNKFFNAGIFRQR